MLDKDESIYHSCGGCGSPKSVWSMTFGQWLCSMCAEILAGNELTKFHPLDVAEIKRRIRRWAERGDDAL